MAGGSRRDASGEFTFGFRAVRIRGLRGEGPLRRRRGVFLVRLVFLETGRALRERLEMSLRTAHSGSELRGWMRAGAALWEGARIMFILAGFSLKFFFNSNVDA